MSTVLASLETAVCYFIPHPLLDLFSLLKESDLRPTLHSGVNDPQNLEHLHL